MSTKGLHWKRPPTSNETRRKLSETHKRLRTRPPSPLGKKRSLETRMKISEGLKGAKNPNWKGRTPEIRRLRMGIEYRLWRESVFKRDNWTCVWCGRVGGELNADHIKRFADYPELRFAIDNGRTLCVPCHRQTATFGAHGKEL